MVETVTFRARARTIDHLGREQIADCPTAVSELWKNAYDAYARSVALHLFDAEVPVAAVVDDGHGMSIEELVERWFTVGTESKVGAEATVPKSDRNGLGFRPRQGQKGIGRLSVAFLGPVCLVLSKRRGAPFCASLIDWRIFENPYLRLDDIRIPVHVFSDTSAFRPQLNEMVEALVENVWGPTKDAPRKERVESAWSKYDEELTSSDRPAASERIVKSALVAALTDEHLNTWPTWVGESDQGTALFVFGVSDELAVWLPSRRTEDPEQELSRDLLRSTLTGFVDPYATNAPDFAYSVLVHSDAKLSTVLSGAEVFTHADLNTLEHLLVGRFTADGTFRGRAKAFGRDMGEFTLKPSHPLPKSGPGVVGPFEFCIGTFEQDLKRTSHSDERHARLRELSIKYGGLAIYRDYLRVMPYGRPDADYFGMEERRSQHAGREFWAHRRSFGRVALTRSANPNLRDKAGREGLIDNRARRELRVLVVDLLKTAARRFFGTGSDVRDEMVPEMRKRKAREADARTLEEAARKKQAKRFRDALRQQSTALEDALRRIERTQIDLDAAIEAKDRAAVSRAGKLIEQAQALQPQLMLPERPKRLGTLEEPYRKYRNAFATYSRALQECIERWANASDSLRVATPVEQIAGAVKKHRSLLGDAVAKWQRDVERAVHAIDGALRDRMLQDLKRFDEATAQIVESAKAEKQPLAETLKALLAARNDHHSELALRYQGRVRAIENLAEDADVESALLWSSEERAELRREVEQVHALAQLGVTVEIVSHEFNDLDSEVRHNLDRLPAQARSLIAFKNASRAYTSLIDRLKFLSPVKLAGPRLAERITGERIEHYLAQFFGTRLHSDKIKFDATPAFRNLAIVEYPSRILPVFINLVNNAIYWLEHASAERRILLDAQDGAAIVADSGPGVDPDDVSSLFTLFFTRRLEGRGVGLYLCKVNLAAGGHRIEYSTDPRFHRLAGAHFVVHFAGTDHA